MKRKVALGFSGGVDSSVAALLLTQQGYDVHCIYLNCFDDDIPGCRTKEDRKDALAVALQLGLPFQVLDFRKEYQQSVIDYFKREYEAGRTPNPDVVCNRDIKFGLFYKWAIEESHFDFLATGHYARLVYRDPNDPNKHPNYPNEDYSDEFGNSDRILLSRPRDERKDQTYFLWQVPRERLSRVLFPLGDYLKSEVREIARDAKLPVAEKKDSTGICFIGEVRVEEFLKRLGVREKPGDVVIRVAQNPKSETLNPKQIQNSNDSNKQNKKSLETLDLEHSNLFRNSDLEIRNSDAFRVIGRHRGVWFYTIGQRHGFSVGHWPPKRKDEGQRTKDEGRIKLDFPRPSALGLQPSADRPPLYVIEKDVEHNHLVVGFGAETYRDRFELSNCNWLVDENIFFVFLHPSSFIPRPLYVRIRHGGELIPCSLSAIRNPQSVQRTSRITNNELRVAIRLSEPQRGIAPGQSAVFYVEDGTVLGGGVISE